MSTPPATAGPGHYAPPPQLEHLLSTAVASVAHRQARLSASSQWSILAYCVAAEAAGAAGSSLTALATKVCLSLAALPTLSRR